MPYSGLPSTLLSVDPNKLYAFPTPPTSVLGGTASFSSPDEREQDRDHLRPTPHLVARESMADSLSDMYARGQEARARALGV